MKIEIDLEGYDAHDYNTFNEYVEEAIKEEVKKVVMKQIRRLLRESEEKIYEKVKHSFSIGDLK